ncbi:MAG: hypothetical protein HY711_06095 [Candidatus Melainabacteria bacterium]|nr:hypothetical protein [Candidatus Melainabacteria bacterium]
MSVLNNAQLKDKRRLRQFGPGTIVLIIGLLVIGCWRLFNPPRVLIERALETSGEPYVERKPSVSDLLAWSGELHLSMSQKDSLGKLLEEEKVKLTDVEDKIVKVTQEFNDFVSKHQTGGAGLEELKGAAEPILELSRQKRRIEQGFVEMGLAVLDKVQKDKVKELWEARLTRRG